MLFILLDLSFTWENDRLKCETLSPRARPSWNYEDDSPAGKECCKLGRQNESESEFAQSCPTLRPHGLQPAGLLHSRDFRGKITGAGCHFLLQGIFPTQGSNPGLPYCRQTLYHLSHQESCSCIFSPFCTGWVLWGPKLKDKGPPSSREEKDRCTSCPI